MYRVAIIGCGRVGSILEEDPLREKPATHSAAFASYPKTKIVAACDTNKQRLKKFGERWSLGPSTLFTDYRKLLKEAKPDIVSVATWTETHCPIVLAAAKTESVKGIYCEKPIALDLKEANRMIAACKKRNIPLVIGHERRFDANFVAVKKMIDKNEFGPLRAVVAHSLSTPPPKLPTSKYVGGSLFHDGTHLMDLLLYFGGEAEWVIGFDKRPHGKRFLENTAGGIIRLRSGANVFVEAGGERDYFKFDLDLQFQSGRIIIGNSGIKIFRSGKSKNFVGFRELFPVPFKKPGNRVNPFVGGVAELVKAIKSGKRPQSDGMEGRNALKLIFAIYQSASAGGKKVYVGRKRGR